MPKISFLAAGLLFIEYLQKSLCSASNVDLAIAAPERTLNDYVCREQYFIGATVKESVERACVGMHTLRRQIIFPALLEETEIFGRDSEPFFTWPILHENIAYTTGVKGNSRIVMNLECELIGVVLRHDKYIEPCLELLHDDNEVTYDGQDLNPQEFVAYKCPRATYKLSHVWDSYRKALKLKTRHYPKPYPVGTAAKEGEDTPYIWPLFKKYIGQRRKKDIDEYGRCYVVFSRKDGILKVIQLRKGMEKKCELIKKTIVPLTPRPNIPQSPQSLGQTSELGYDCSGQIFTGRYIEMSREKAIKAIRDELSGKKSIGIYKHNVKRNGISPGSWKWPIRGWEASRQGTKRSRLYALIFRPNLQFLGVHILGRAGYIKCKTIDDSKHTSNGKKKLRIDLNLPHFCQETDSVGDCSP